MPERGFDFSKLEDQQKFEQLPNEEKGHIIVAAQDEAVEVQTRAHRFAGENKNPSTHHYEEASKQVNRIKEQYKVTLTPEQEKIENDLFGCLHTNPPKITVANEIINKNVLPKEIIYQIIKNAFSEFYLSNRSMFHSAAEIKNKLSLPNEIVQEIIDSAEVQKMLRESYIKGYAFGRDFDDNFPLLINVSEKKLINDEIVIEEVRQKIKKKEKDILNFLKFISSLPKNERLRLKLDDEVISQYSRVCKYEFTSEEKMIILATLTSSYNDSADHGKRIGVFLSIFDKEIREAFEAKYFLYLEESIGIKSFLEQIEAEKPDIVFLAARSAVPWGITYKKYAKSKNKYNSQIKIPEPEFKLADVKLRFKTQDSSIFKSAVDRYAEKLAPLKKKIDSGILKEPVKIALFDESGDSGSTKTMQILAIDSAIKKLQIKASVIGFNYVTSNPNNISPISHIDKKSIARRTPRGEEVLEEWRRMKKFDLEDAFLYKMAFDKLYEKESLKILRAAGEWIFGKNEKDIYDAIEKINKMNL